MSTESITVSLPLGEAVTKDHFGVNFVDAFDRVQHEGNAAGLSDFLEDTQNGTEGLNDMGLTSLRWPGGADIERYALNVDANGAVDLVPKEDITGQEQLNIALLEDFLEFCGDNGVSAKIIIPTEWLTDSQYASPGQVATDIRQVEIDAVAAFVAKVMEIAQNTGATIDGFEIGNEYRGVYTAQGYSAVLNQPLMMSQAMGPMRQTSSPKCRSTQKMAAMFPLMISQLKISTACLKILMRGSPI